MSKGETKSFEWGEKVVDYYKWLAEPLLPELGNLSAIGAEVEAAVIICLGNLVDKEVMENLGQQAKSAVELWNNSRDKSEKVRETDLIIFESAVIFDHSLNGEQYTEQREILQNNLAMNTIIRGRQLT